MKIRVDTNEMSYAEVNALIQDLKAIRTRKAELKARLNDFCSLITAMRYADGMTFVNNATGEILNPDDWDLYDETTHSFYHNEECKE